MKKGQKAQIYQCKNYYSRNKKINIQQYLHTKLSNSHQKYLSLQNPKIKYNEADVLNIKKQLQLIRTRRQSLRSKPPPQTQRYKIQIANSILDIKKQISKTLNAQTLTLSKERRQPSPSKLEPITHPNRLQNLQQKSEQIVCTPKFKIQWNHRSSFLEPAAKKHISKQKTQEQQKKMERELIVRKGRQSGREFSPWEIRQNNDFDEF